MSHHTDKGSSPLVAREPAVPKLNVDQRALRRFCELHRVRRLSLFGSHLKGTARADSDIDLLVEFLPEARPTLLDVAQMEIELSQLLGGRQVDLRTAQDLSRHFRDEVLRTAEPQYVAG
jgi:hypothetical protein